MKLSKGKCPNIDKYSRIFKRINKYTREALRRRIERKRRKKNAQLATMSISGIQASVSEKTVGKILGEMTLSAEQEKERMSLVILC